MLNQLTLGVGLKDDATFANYYSSNNAALLAALESAASGKGEKFIYIHGAGGQGCTHLLQACCHHAHQHHLTSVYLPLGQLLMYPPEILLGLESLALVCMDDLHAVAGRPEWEEAIFHAYNRIQESDSRLIVTANVPPKLLNFALPDLVSRLTSGVIYSLQPLSDDEKLSVLMLRASRRGMVLTEEVAKFLLTHCPRHMTTLFAALDALDKASLAAQRKLTVPFVKTVLEI